MKNATRRDTDLTTLSVISYDCPKYILNNVFSSLRMYAFTARFVINTILEKFWRGKQPKTH